MADSKTGTADNEEAQGLELFLLKLRYKEGRLLQVEGNSPLLLTEPDTAWVVYAGRVDIFAVAVHDGAAAGPRRHLFRAEVGYVLFSLADAERPASGLSLLATGNPGTRVLRIKLPRLRDLATNLEYAEIIIGLLDNWITGLSAGIARDIPPKEAILLDADQPVTLKAGAVALPRKGVLWATQPTGESRFMGRAELAPIAGPGYLPLSRYTWLQTTQESTLTTATTATVLERDPTWTGLRDFHRLALESIVLNKQQAETAERDRLLKKAATQRLVVEGAFTQIAALLEPTVLTPFSNLGLDITDPTLAVCRVVGRALGIHIVAPPAGRKSTTVPDAVRNIAHASNVRTRQVLLRGAWWQRDNGPLLGFVEANGRPVALMPTAQRSYELDDPVTRSRTPLTPTVAHGLEPFAISFYRPFPTRAVNLLDLLRFGLRGTRADLNTILLMGLAAGLLGTLTPLATGYIFDQVIPNAATSLLLQIGLGLFLIALASTLFQITRSVAVLRVEGRMDGALQAAVWDRLLDLPAPFFRNYSAGDLGARAMGVNTIREALSGPIITSILTGVFSVFNLVLLFYYQAALALVATLLVVLSMVITTGAGYLQVRHQRALTEVQGRISGQVLQFVNGIAKFRVAGIENRAFALWARQFSRQKRLAYKARTVANGLAVVNAAYPIVTTMAIFAMVAIARDAGLSTGAFLAFNAAFSQLLIAGIALSTAVVSILGIVPLYERAQPILRALPEVDEAKADPGELTGAIEVSHISFRYKENSPLILKDISLQIKPGEFVALVGASGSGKSTLFRILLGFEKPESGAVYYDGQDLTGVDLREVRRQMGVVLQNGKLMVGDIFQNIAGSSLVTLDDAWDAARMAGFEDDVKLMPMGMHTVIGEGGGTLSGGQRQRLMIARAIVKKPRILYFDEATSALDNRTQDIVSRSLDNLQATRVVIAHRLSTIVNADRIFVLEDGRVVQSGTYGELVDQPGLFAELAKRQIA